MEAIVYNKEGKATAKKVQLNDEIFNIEPNDHAIYLDVKAYLANQRQGTSKSKQRNEIAGSTKKLKKQKGTGTARAGSIKSPLFRGGGRVFGPVPRDYTQKLNKKVKKLARKSALSSLLKKESIVVVEDFNMTAPKTSEYKQFLGNFGIADKKSLLVVPELNKTVYLSSRNLRGARVVLASELNTYDIMNANKLLLCESSVSKLETILSI